MTEIQKVVIDARLIIGYSILGETLSILNGLPAYLIVKGKHTLVINSLGYDEHLPGMSWKLI